MKNHMMQRWADLTSGSPASPSMCLRVYDAIKSQYDGAGRHYHSFDHIDRVLTYQEQYLPDAPTEVKLALWFHDIVYYPGFKLNERMSAKLMLHLLSAHGPAAHQVFADDTVVKTAAPLVRATESHLATDANSAIVCDLDLLSLAADPEEYARGTALIRREFEQYPDNLWELGRKIFIERFLARPFIFQTERMQERYEQVARSSLERERALYT